MLPEIVNYAVLILVLSVGVLGAVYTMAKSKVAAAELRKAGFAKPRSARQQMELPFGAVSDLDLVELQNAIGQEIDRLYPLLGPCCLTVAKHNYGFGLIVTAFSGETWTVKFQQVGSRTLVESKYKPVVWNASRQRFYALNLVFRFDIECTGAIILDCIRRQLAARNP